MSYSLSKKKLFIEISVIRLIVIILQLVFLKLYAKYTSTYDLGIYYFWVTASYSLNAFFLVPLDYFQQSKLYVLKSSLLSIKSFNPINIKVLYSAFITIAIAMIITSIVKMSMCSYIFFSIATSYGVYYVNLYRGIINNYEKRRQAIYTLLLEVLIKITLYLILIKFYPPTSLLIMIASLFASICSWSLLFFLVKRLDEYKFKGLADFKPKEIFSFSYPLSIGAAINWIQLQSYRLMLVPLGFVEMVGVYGTVSNVGSGGMNAYSTIFNQLFLPNLYKSKGFYLKTYIRNALLSVFFVLICAFFLRKIIVQVLTKVEFIEYSTLILYGVIAEAGNFLVNGLTVYVTIHNLTQETTKLGFYGLVCFVIIFGALVLFKFVNIYTIGLPIIITQLFTVIILMIMVIKHKNSVANNVS